MTNRGWVITGGQAQTGVDGDLFGLVPERQALPETAHIDVTTTSVTTYQDWTAGGVTVTAGTYPAAGGAEALGLAGRIADVAQDASNVGQDGSVLRSFTPTEGNLIRIDVAPGDYANQPLIFNHNTLNFPRLRDNEAKISWVRGWLDGAPQNTSTQGRVVRDIVFVGTGASPSDVIFPQTEFRYNPDQNAYDGQIDNVRFENLTFKNINRNETLFMGANEQGNMNDYPEQGSGNGQSFFHAERLPAADDGVVGDVWHNEVSDRFYYKTASTTWTDKGPFNDRFPKTKYQGVLKIYDCEIRGRETTNFQGTGQKMAIRLQGYGTGLDVRNVLFWPSEEHSIYVDHREAFLYAVNCSQKQDYNGPSGLRAGNGITFWQGASRRIVHAAAAPLRGCKTVFIRCVTEGNLTTHGRGGYDFTCWGGHPGTVYLKDCTVQGSAIPHGGPTSDGESRGGLNFTQESGYDNDIPVPVAKGASVFETSPGSGVWYGTKKLVVEGLRFETYGNQRATNSLNGCEEIEYGFTFFQSSDYAPQFEMNRNQNGGTTGTVPYRPNLSFTWGAEMQPTPSASPPFLAGDGSNPSFPSVGNADIKVRHRLTDDHTTTVDLSDGEIDAYDGSNP